MEVIARDVLARLEGALEDVSGRDEKLRSLFQDVVHPIEDYLDVEPEWKKYSLYYEVTCIPDPILRCCMNFFEEICSSLSLSLDFATLLISRRKQRKWRGGRRKGTKDQLQKGEVDAPPGNQTDSACSSRYPSVQVQTCGERD